MGDISDVLVIEDTPEHIEHVKSLLGDRGVVVSDYNNFLIKVAVKPKLVLSDLYFPSGYPAESYLHKKLKDDTLAVLDDYIKLERGDGNPIAVAVNQVVSVGALGNTPKEVVKNLQLDIPGLRQQVEQRVKDADRLKTYENLRDAIAKDEHLLPLGMFVYQKCQELGIPAVIVTDAYHHGTEFQPFVAKVGKYFDQLVDGKKQWKAALDSKELR